MCNNGRCLWRSKPIYFVSRFFLWICFSLFFVSSFLIMRACSHMYSIRFYFYTRRNETSQQVFYVPPFHSIFHRVQQTFFFCFSRDNNKMSSQSVDSLWYLFLLLNVDNKKPISIKNFIKSYAVFYADVVCATRIPSFLFSFPLRYTSLSFIIRSPLAFLSIASRSSRVRWSSSTVPTWESFFSHLPLFILTSKKIKGKENN